MLPVLSTTAIARLVLAFVTVLGTLALPGCKDFPGADGRYATRDGGGGNRGGALRGLPVTPYNPNQLRPEGPS